jgi:RNA polymerase sigma factor (sigma-70 family)
VAPDGRYTRAGVNDPLLHKVAAGDQQAVAELTRRYGGLVYSLARRMYLGTGGQSELDDAVQDVFIAIWKSAGRYDAGIAAEETFISMVARRRLIDRRRRAIRRSGEQPTEDFSYMPAKGAYDPSHGASMEVSEDAKRAGELLKTLRPEQQKVLRLSVGQGMSHEQISELLGMPLGTVKTHVRRGLLALREGMSKDPNPRPGAVEEQSEP